jgi:uncharacterized protein (UPF0335 family)
MTLQSETAEKLEKFIEHIERLEEEKVALSEDIKCVYDEAANVGFDKKILKQVVRRRKLDKEQLEHEEGILQTYEAALNGIVDDE